MSRSKSNTESVSLFPFLAVLVCAMGALIFLLIVTTRRIRTQAIAKAHQQREAEPPAGVVPKIEPEPSPIEEPVRTGLPPWPGTVMLGNVQPTPFDVPLPEVEEEPPRELPPPPPIEWFIRHPDPPDPNVALRGKLEKYRQLRTAWQSEVARRADKTEQFVARRKQIDAEIDKLEQSLKQSQAVAAADAQLANELASRMERIRGQLAKTDHQISLTRRMAANSPTKFAIAPFDGRTGTNMRPVLIELTGQGVRFVPENVILSPEDFDGYTNEVNPLLAATQALLDYWSEISRRSGGAEPEPYVMLIVRPSGAEFFNARNLLAALDRPIGYELLEENLPLDVPEADPKAAESVRQAIANLKTQRRQLRQLLVDRGTPGNGYGGYGEEDVSARNLLSGISPDDISAEAGGDVRRLPPGLRENGTARDKADTFAAIASERAQRGIRGPSARPMKPTGQPNRSFGANADTRSRQEDFTGTSQQPGSKPSGGGTHIPPAPSADVDPNEPRRLFTQNGQRGDELGQFGSLAANDPTKNNPTRNNPTSPDGNRNPSEQGRPPQSANSDATPNGPSGSSDVASTQRQPMSANPSRSSNGSPNGNGTPSANSGKGEPMLPDFATLYMRNKRRNTEPRPHRWGYSDPRATIGFERSVPIEIYPDHLIVGDAFLVRTAKAETADQISVWMLEAIERTARSWSYPPTKFYWVPTLDFRVAPGAEKLYGHLDQTAIEWGLQRKVSRLQTGTEGQP